MDINFFEVITTAFSSSALKNQYFVDSFITGDEVYLVLSEN